MSWLPVLGVYRLGTLPTVVALRPSMLILFDRYENSLYSINNELAGYDGAVKVQWHHWRRYRQPTSILF